MHGIDHLPLPPFYKSPLQNKVGQDYLLTDESSNALAKFMALLSSRLFVDNANAMNPMILAMLQSILSQVAK